MSYERLAVVAAPTAGAAVTQPAKVSFFYAIEAVFNDASLRSMYQAKAIKSEAGDSLVDQFAITEDERVIHLGLMEDAVWDIFTNFLKYTKSIAAPIAHNESYTSTAVKQKETITLTGTAGIAHVTVAGGLDKTVTFATDLTTTAANFVSTHAAAYLVVGIVVTSVGINIIFEASVAGT